MKKLSALTVAIVLGLGGIAMANDSGENHQDNTNTGAPNSYAAQVSTPRHQGYAAFAKAPVQHRTVTRDGQK